MRLTCSKTLAYPLSTQTVLRLPLRESRYSSDSASPASLSPSARDLVNSYPYQNAVKTFAYGWLDTQELSSAHGPSARLFLVTENCEGEVQAIISPNRLLRIYGVVSKDKAGKPDSG